MPVGLKNDIFTLKEKNLKQKRSTRFGIDTKFAPLYSILLMPNTELKPKLWWRYTDGIFFLWEHGEEKLKEFIKYLNEKHPTTKFTAE